MNNIDERFNYDIYWILPEPSMNFSWYKYIERQVCSFGGVFYSIPKHYSRTNEPFVMCLRNHSQTFFTNGQTMFDERWDIKEPTLIDKVTHYSFAEVSYIHTRIWTLFSLLTYYTFVKCDRYSGARELPMGMSVCWKFSERARVATIKSK